MILVSILSIHALIQFHDTTCDTLRARLHGEFQPGLKFRSAHRAEILLWLHAKFQPGRKTQSLLRCENTVNAHACVPFSAGAKIPFRLHETDSDFQARLAGLKILARYEHTGLGFSPRAELRPGLNPSPCNRQFGFQRICFRSRSEISALDEIRHVIGPWVSIKLSASGFRF